MTSKARSVLERMAQQVAKNRAISRQITQLLQTAQCSTDRPGFFKHDHLSLLVKPQRQPESETFEIEIALHSLGASRVDFGVFQIGLMTATGQLFIGKSRGRGRFVFLDVPQGQFTLENWSVMRGREECVPAVGLIEPDGPAEGKTKIVPFLGPKTGTQERKIAAAKIKDLISQTASIFKRFKDNQEQHTLAVAANTPIDEQLNELRRYYDDNPIPLNLAQVYVTIDTDKDSIILHFMGNSSLNGLPVVIDRVDNVENEVKGRSISRTIERNGVRFALSELGLSIEELDQVVFWVEIADRQVESALPQSVGRL